MPNPKVGFYANDCNQNVTSRDDAVFDFFRLPRALPDEHAADDDAELDPGRARRRAAGTARRCRSRCRPRRARPPSTGSASGAFQAYDAPFTLDDDGTHAVDYRSSDAAGNHEAAKSFSVKVDVTPPASSATLAPAAPGAGGTYDGPVTVTLSGTDAAGGSGLGGLEYRVDGGEWTAYAQPWRSSAEGAHTVEHRATDVAGNTGTAGSVTFTIEGDDPDGPRARRRSRRSPTRPPARRRCWSSSRRAASTRTAARSRTRGRSTTGRRSARP